jgi:hypothetical protein
MTGTGSKKDFDAMATKYIKEAIAGSTSINGGLILTKLIMTEDSSHTVKSGMSGMTGDNIGLWTGGTYNEALNGTAKTVLRKDGSGYLAGGKIKWDKKEDEDGYELNIEGTIVVENGGKIGSFDVDKNGQLVGNNNGVNVIMTPNDIPDKATIGTRWDILTSSNRFEAYEYDMNGTYTHDIFRFTLNQDSNIRFNFGLSAAANMDNYIYSAEYVDMSISVYIQGPSGRINLSHLYWSEGWYRKDSTVAKNKTFSYDSSASPAPLPAGEYTVKISIALAASTTRPDSDSEFSLDLKPWGAAKLEAELPKTTSVAWYGGNGFILQYEDYNYMFFDKDNGFEVRTDMFGLRCNKADGLQKYDSDVGDWVNL